MSTALKIKYWLIVTSVIILVITSLYQSNFFKKDQIIRYQELSWSDFNGTPVPFSQWAATIDTDLFLEFDSTLNRFSVYAGMNKSSSWKKKSQNSSDVLNHEQYHFKLSHYYAQMVDNILTEETSLNEALEHLTKMKNDHTLAQSKFDSESDHNLNLGFQSYWEFKIDSLLSSINPNTNSIRNDLYTGIQFYNFSELRKEKKLSESGSFQTIYEGNLKEAWVSVTSVIRNETSENYDLKEAINTFYEKDSLEIQDIKNLELDGNQQVIAEVRDTIKNWHTYDKWISDPESLHLLRLRVNITSPQKGYLKLFESLANSLQLKKYQKDWLQIAEEEKYTKSKTQEYDPSEEMGCLVIDKSDTPGYVPYILTSIEGDLIIPYTPILHPDSLIYDVTLFYGDNQIVQDMSDSIVFKIPQNELSPEFQIMLGYTLKTDTINECQTFLNESLVLTTN